MITSTVDLERGEILVLHRCIAIIEQNASHVTQKCDYRKLRGTNTHCMPTYAKNISSGCNWQAIYNITSRSQRDERPVASSEGMDPA